MVPDNETWTVCRYCYTMVNQDFLKKNISFTYRDLDRGEIDITCV